MEMFQDIDGRSEQFLAIEVHVTGELVLFDPSTLDAAGRKRFNKAVQCRKWRAYRGVAKVAWRTEQARRDCIEDHSTIGRRRRWQDALKYADRMRQGEYPPFGHVYLHPSLTHETNLRAIDGTRRMLAFCEAGEKEVPVVILGAQE